MIIFYFVIRSKYHVIMILNICFEFNYLPAKNASLATFLSKVKYKSYIQYV